MTECLNLDASSTESADSFTLTVVRNAKRIILGKKTRGFGEGLLVLLGGKDHHDLRAGHVGVTASQSNASREVFEEIGFYIPPRDLCQVGILHVTTENGRKNVSIFEAQGRQITPQDSTELEDVAWHDETALLYEGMPSDYRLWLPHVLTGYAIAAYLQTYNDRLIGGSVHRHPLGRPDMTERLPVEIP